MASDGGIFAFGDAGFHGSMGAIHLNQPVVGIAATPDGNGYWEVASDGGIFAFGDAGFHGSMGAIHLNQPVVGIAATPDGNGYWEVAADGGIFAFGDAGFHGSMGAIRLNQPVVGIAATPDGNGYWEVAADGGIFAFGDAGFHGSMGAIRLNQPVVGIAATPDGNGYWEVAADGGIFAFGDAGFHGSMGATHLNQPVVGIAADARRQRVLGGGRQTAASSPSATPGSTGRWVRSVSISPSWASPRLPTATATGRWPRTAASSPSATPGSTGRWVPSVSTGPSWGCPPSEERLPRPAGRSAVQVVTHEARCLPGIDMAHGSVDHHLGHLLAQYPEAEPRPARLRSHLGGKSQTFVTSTESFFGDQSTQPDSLSAYPNLGNIRPVPSPDLRQHLRRR